MYVTSNDCGFKNKNYVKVSKMFNKLYLQRDFDYTILVLKIL